MAVRAPDLLDRQLLRALERDSRISLRELGALVGLSAPAVRDRLRRLEEDGVVERFTVELDARALGFAMEAIVRVEPLPGRMREVEEMIRAMPQVTACDVVTGDDCFIARLALRSIEDLDTLLQPMHHLARTSSSIVKRRLVSHRSVPLS